MTRNTWNGPLLKFSNTTAFTTGDIKIRNCVMLNCYFQATVVAWQGENNEISNCLVVGTMISGLDNTASQPQMTAATGGSAKPTKVVIKNNSVLYQWRHDKAVQGDAISLGKVGNFTVKDNIFAWSQKGWGVKSALNNTDVQVMGNVFYMNDYGTYTHADANAQSTLAGGGGGGGGEEEEEEEEETGPAGHVIKGNIMKDPGLKPDKTFLMNYTGWSMHFGEAFVKQKDVIDALRKEYGLPHIAKVGDAVPPKEQLWGNPYPLDKVFPNLLSQIKGKGVQFDGPFATYEARPDPETIGSVPGGKDEYTLVTWEDMLDKTKSAGFDGKKVKFRAGLGPMEAPWEQVVLDKKITANDYANIMLVKPGTTSMSQGSKFFAYVVLGTAAAKRYNENGVREVRKKTWAKGVYVRGILYKAPPSYGRYPLIMVVDYIGK